MQELEQKMLEYKSVTDELIDSVEKEDYDSLSLLFDKRQSIIEEIDKLNYSTEEFFKICFEFRLLDLQKKLDDLVKIKNSEMKSEIKKVKQIRMANRSYNYNNYIDSIYFNKKI